MSETTTRIRRGMPRSLLYALIPLGFAILAIGFAVIGTDEDMADATENPNPPEIVD